MKPQLPSHPLSVPPSAPNAIRPTGGRPTSRRWALRVAAAAVAAVAAIPLGLSAQQSADVAAGTPTPPLANFDTAWASIARTYYDTTLVRGRWQLAHDSIRASLGSSPNVEQVRAAIRALSAIPGESHFALIPADAVPPAGAAASSARLGTVGLEFRPIGDTLLIWHVAAGSSAEAAGLRPGDIVTHVDTLSLAALAERLARALPEDASMAQMLLARTATAMGRRAIGDTAIYGIVDARGRARRVELVHQAATGTITRFGNLPPQVLQTSSATVSVGPWWRRREVPVIHWSAWFPAISPRIDEMLFAAREAPGVIIDLRGNPGGVVGMISGVAGHFSDSSWNLGTMYGRGSTLFLRANPRVVDGSGTRRGVITAPVAILVDGFTASASEFFASGMQALGRARVFGEPSAGMALPALMRRLPDGDVLMHPIANHEDANGRRVEGVGVIPDTPAPLTRPALLRGEDPALDAARRWLARQLR